MTLSRTLSVRVLAAMLAVMTAWGGAARAADPVEVFIDARDPAFLVIQGVAADTPRQARQEMAGYAALEDVSLMPWDSFRQNAQAYIAPYILKNDYPGVSLALSVVALVQTYPGRPFAVTWNGGLAVTFMDYQHAVTTYRAFLESAEAYERSRPADPGADPVNPANTLPGLLNR